MRNGMCLMALGMLAATHVLAGDAAGEAWPEVTWLTEARPAKDGETVERALAARRSASVRIMIAVLQDAKLPRSNRIAAANMLAELRAPEAVDALVQQLMLGPDLIDEKTLRIAIPCVCALIEIGIPASRKALRYLQDEDDAVRKRMLCFIIDEVEGQAVAEFLLKSELEKSPSLKAKKNLEEALKMLAERWRPPK